MKRKEARSLAVHSTLLNIKRSRVLYLMLAPALIYFVVFKLQAILGMALAFYDYRIVGPHELWVSSTSRSFSPPPLSGRS